MVDIKSVEAQLKRIKFSSNAWGRAEVKELPNILTPDEKIYDCVNGIYDGGFALLVATDMRVLLIDKKPLNYLTVEDLRFDMINEIDYSHRLLGAKITISAGSKTLNFRSYNQQRLRKLIGHVQDRMSEIKKEASEHQENQKHHLAQINQQLQAYLLAQHQQLLQIQQGVISAKPPELPKPSPELSDYLFAQSLLAENGLKHDPLVDEAKEEAASAIQQEAPAVPAATPVAVETDDLVAVGREEIFGKAKLSSLNQPAPPQPSAQPNPWTRVLQQPVQWAKELEVNPVSIAYSKLPMLSRSRRTNGQPAFQPSTTPQQAA